MAGFVVHRLEAVQIDEQQRVRARMRRQLLDAAGQAAAVEQPGEHVVAGLGAQLLGQHPQLLLAFAGAQFRGAQFALVALHRGDVGVQRIVLAADAAVHGHAHPAVPGQRHLERRPGEIGRIVQGRGEVLRPLPALVRVGRGVPQPLHDLHVGLLLQRRPGGQAVQLHEVFVREQDASLVVQHRRGLPDVLQHLPGIGRRQRQLAGMDAFRARALVRLRHVLPDAHAPAARLRHRSHAQPAPPVLEHVGPCLRAVACQAVGDEAVDVGQVVGRQPPQIEAPQVVGIGLSRVNTALVLREKAQERGIPEDGAFLGIEHAQGDAQRIQERGGQVEVHGLGREREGMVGSAMRCRSTM